MDIIKELKKEINKLLNSDESAYRIGKETGVDASQIQRLRSGDRSLEKMQLKNIEKLYNYAITKKSS